MSDDDFESVVQRWWDDDGIINWHTFVDLCKTAVNRSLERGGKGPKMLADLERYVARGFPLSLHPIGSPSVFVSYWPIMTRAYVACTRALVDDGPSVRWAEL